jgi:hypothetical protein
MIIHCKGQIPSPDIRIALLTSLCDPQVLSYLLYQLFCILDNIQTEYLPLANLTQYSGVLHFRPYRASKGDFLRLA